MNQPYLKIVYVNSGGIKTVVKTELMGDGIDSIVDAIKDALKGMGFGAELVDGYFEEE